MYRNFNVLRFPLKLVLARFKRGACGNDTFGYWPFIIGCHHRLFLSFPRESKFTENYSGLGFHRVLTQWLIVPRNSRTIASIVRGLFTIVFPGS